MSPGALEFFCARARPERAQNKRQSKHVNTQKPKYVNKSETRHNNVKGRKKSIKNSLFAVETQQTTLQPHQKQHQHGPNTQANTQENDAHEQRKTTTKKQQKQQNITKATMIFTENKYYQ